MNVHYHDMRKVTSRSRYFKSCSKRPVTLLSYYYFNQSRYLKLSYYL